MELGDVLAKLGETASLEALKPGWERSMAALPEGMPRFLRPGEIRSNGDWAGLPAGILPEIESTAARIASDPALLRLAWHACRLVFEEPDGARVSWPGLEAALPGAGGVFYLLIAMDLVPRIRAAHRSREIPERVTRDTCLDIRIASDRYRSITGGRLGVESRLLFWHRLIATGDLHRLGRMQYLVRPFRGRLRAYRHRETGRTLALSLPEVRYNREGYVDGAGGITDAEGGWVSRLAEDEAGVTGNPISPRGMAVNREVSLSFREWACALSPGDPVLEMHIPEGEAMTLEACADSMGQALEFFPRYYPDRPFAGFGCSSWIFNTQLEEMLPPSSNLVRYQHELYLYPTPSSGRDGLYFIFYRDEVDPATAPRDTSLKRAVLDRLSSGRPLRGGGMFMLKEDFRHFGSGHYRAQWIGDPDPLTP